MSEANAAQPRVVAQPWVNEHQQSKTPKGWTYISPAWLGATWALLAYRTGMEEQNLVEKFGPEYEDYKQPVGMFFPRLHMPSRDEPVPMG